MNAPAAPYVVTQIEQIPIKVIRPSRTHIQALRRAHFNQEALLELADSISRVGVLQPITVRPIPVDDHRTFEIVAGERRWIAADRAGLAHIAAIVRELTDEEVLEAQLVENLQREDLNPLEEAEGYAELKSLKGYDAERIGELIGKSKSYVYARMKLTALCTEARAALDAGAIDFSKALLLARVPEALQPKGLKLLTEQNYQGDSISYKRAFSELREKFMVPLGTALFTLDDATLFRMVKVAGKRGVEEPEPLPACNTCPSNSANDNELQRDLKSDAYVCINSSCFELKTVAFHERRRKELEAEQVEIVSGEAAKKIIPRKDKIVGHVDLDEVCLDDMLPDPEPRPAKDEDYDSPAFQARLTEWQDRDDAFQQRTYRQLLADQKLDVIRVEDPKSKKVRELVPLKPVREALAKEHKIKLAGYVGAPVPKHHAVNYAEQQKSYEQERRERDAREARELAYRRAVLAAIADKCAGPVKREDVIDLVDAVTERLRQEPLKPFFGGKVPEPGQLKDDELGKYVRLTLVVGCTTWAGTQPGPLLAMAKRYKVDAAKIKRDLEAAAKSKEAAEPAAKPKAAAKKKTPAKKAATKKATKK